MTTLSEEDTDGEYLNDPIQINFGDNGPSLDDLQVLDPGIIVLDSSDDENSKPTEKFSPPRAATSLDPATSENKHGNPHLIPTIIKLVDCFKFPRYFDKYTRQIIEKNIYASESANTKTTEIVMNTQKTWRFWKKRQKADIELQNALKQRSKSEIDAKRNTGLIGIKIKRMPIYKSRKEKEVSKVMQNTEGGALNMRNVQSALLNAGTIITPVLTDTPDFDQMLPSLNKNQNDDLSLGTCDINVDSSNVPAKKDVNINSFKVDSFHNVTEHNNILYDKAVKVAKEITRLYNTKDGIKDNEELNELKETSLQPMPMCKKKDFQHKRKTVNGFEQKTLCESNKTKNPMLFSSKVDEKITSDKGDKLQLAEKIDGNVRVEKNKTKLFIHKSKNCVFDDNNPEAKLNVKPQTPITLNSSTEKSFPHISYMNRFTKKILHEIQSKKRFRQPQTIANTKLFRKDVNLSVTSSQSNSSDAFKNKPSINNKHVQKEIESKNSVIKQTNEKKTFEVNSSTTMKLITNESKITDMNLRKNDNKSKYLLKSSMNNSYSHECCYVDNKSPLKHHIMESKKTENINDRTNNSVSSEIMPSNVVKSNYLVSQTNNISARKPRLSTQRKQSLKAVPPEDVGNIDDYMKINLNKVSINPVDNCPQLPLESPNELNMCNNRNNTNMSASNRQKSPPVPISSNYQAYAKPLTVYNSLQSHVLYRPQNLSISPPPQMFPKSPLTCNYRTPMIHSNHPQVAVYQQPRHPMPNMPPSSYIRGCFPSMVMENQIHQHNMLYWRYRLPPPRPPPPPPPLPHQPPKSSRLPYISPAIDDSIIGRNTEGIVTKINIPPCAHLKISKKSDSNDYKLEVESIAKPDSLRYDKVLSSVPESSKQVTTQSEMRQELDVSVERMSSPIDYLRSFIGELHAPSPHNVLNRALTSVNNNYKQYSLTDNNNSLSSIQQTENIVSNMQKIIDNIYKTALDNKVPPLNKNADNSTSKKNKKLYKSSTTERNITQMNKFRKVDAEAKQSNHKSEPKLIAPELQNTTQESSISQTYPIKNKINDNRELQKHTSELVYFMNSLPNERNESERKSKSTHLEKSQKINSSTDTKSEVSHKHNEHKSVNLKRKLSNNDSHKTSPNVNETGQLSKKLKVSDPKSSCEQTKIPERLRRSYLPPIRPIPTYEEILSESRGKRYDKHFEKIKMNGAVCAKSSSNKSLTKKGRIPFQSYHKDGSRRISLDEHKKRTSNDSRINKERRTFTKTRKEIAVEKNIVDMPRRVSNVDSDLGYDSDSTIKL